MRALDVVYNRSPGRRGLRALGNLLSSAFEPPAFNAAVNGFEVDALWAKERLIVELDGFSFHRTRRAFEQDRMRDAELMLAGYRVVRITSRRLEHEPEAVAIALRSLVEQPRPDR